MPVVLIARFPGDVEALTRAYDEAHAIIVERGGPPPGELRHHCAIGDDALYLIGVWESEELRERFESREFKEILASAGFPSPDSAEITVLNLHAIGPPLP